MKEWILFCNFSVYGIPKPQPRHRIVVRKRRVHAYYPDTTDDWKTNITLAAKPYLPPKPLTGPIKCDIEFLMPRPEDHFRTGRFSHILKDDAPFWHITGTGKYGGDRDNLDKPVLDVLTETRTRRGMWKDDGQVCTGTPEKHYVTSGHKTGAIITIYWWGRANEDKPKKGK